jgi:hypothetical protein
MPESLLIFLAAAFLFAGFVKGVLGLGLPTVSMGLLAVTMPPAQALAIVIVPAVVTNVWQTFVGPYLRDILRRLWPLMIGTAVGIYLNAGSLTGPYARYGAIPLGILLVIYAIMGLRKFSFSVTRRDEKWIGGIVGLVTGLISAATGVQVIPSMPFLQAIGMEKDELVQALGVFFTVATADRQSHEFGTVDGGHCPTRRARDGLLVYRHVHRTSRAHADACGSLPPLVPDRDDLSRALSFRQRDLQARPRLIDLIRTAACLARRRRTPPRIARGSGPAPAGFRAWSRR